MYLRNVIASVVFNLARPTQSSRRLAQLARQFLPYGLFKRKDGRFLVLNREYKPMGWPPGRNQHFDYESDDLLLLTLPADAVNAQPNETGMVMLYQLSPWKDATAANDYRRTITNVLGVNNFGEAGE